MASLIARARQRYRGQRGAELIEFAFILPILLLIIAGITDFGFAFKEYEVLTNAAREGARLGTLPGYSVADVTARVKSYAAGSGLATTTPPLTVTPTFTTIPVGAGTALAVHVQVSYVHQFVILGPLATLTGGTFNNVTLTASSTMRKELQGS